MPSQIRWTGTEMEVKTSALTMFSRRMLSGRNPKPENSVVITGTNFTGATGVTFHGTVATFTVDSDTQITATAPARAAGTINLSVTAPGVTVGA